MDQSQLESQFLETTDYQNYDAKSKTNNRILFYQSISLNCKLDRNQAVSDVE